MKKIVLELTEAEARALYLLAQNSAEEIENVLGEETAAGQRALTKLNEARRGWRPRLP